MEQAPKGDSTTQRGSQDTAALPSFCTLHLQGLLWLCHVTLVRGRLAHVTRVFQAELYLELLSQPPSVLLQAEIPEDMWGI